MQDGKKAGQASEEAHQKKFGKSDLDQRFQKTKKELKVINQEIKMKQDQEKNAERQKLFATSAGGAAGGDPFGGAQPL